MSDEFAGLVAWCKTCKAFRLAPWLPAKCGPCGALLTMVAVKITPREIWPVSREYGRESNAARP